jgi:hypothetical protein
LPLRRPRATQGGLGRHAGGLALLGRHTDLAQSVTNEPQRSSCQAGWDAEEKDWGGYALCTVRHVRSWSHPMGGYPQCRFAPAAYEHYSSVLVQLENSAEASERLGAPPLVVVAPVGAAARLRPPSLRRRRLTCTKYRAVAPFAEPERPQHSAPLSRSAEATGERVQVGAGVLTPPPAEFCVKLHCSKYTSAL